MANNADHSRGHRCVCCNETMPPAPGLHRYDRSVNLVNLVEREQFACALISPNAAGDVFQQFQQASAGSSGVLCHACHLKIEEYLRLCGSESAFFRRVGQGQGEGEDRAAGVGQNNPRPKTKKSKAKFLAFAIPAAVLGGAAAVIAAPVAVAAVGFGTGGIAAGSLAASMMSSAWTTGIGVGVVSTLQSVGAAGMGAAGTAFMASAGGATGAGVGGLLSRLVKGEQQQPAVDIALCRIQLENQTDIVLSQPRMQLQRGVLLSEPSSTIAPSSEGVLVLAEKTTVATGFSGTVSWCIPNKGRLVVIAWYVPFGSSPSDLWMAVGLSEQGIHPPGDAWFAGIDSRANLRDLQYTRRAIGEGICTVRDSDFVVEGIMKVWNPVAVTINVLLRPIFTEDVVRNQMKKMTLNEVD